jgi:phosphohistidine phosphatase
MLLRHAKSSWAEPGLRDHDRPLNERGRRAAMAMGAYLRTEGLVPELVLCSSARRTSETLALLELPGWVAIAVEHALYLAPPAAVLARLREVDDSVGRLMVIGHNPTMHALALELVGSGEPAALARLAEKYPTGALAVLRVNGDWADLDRRGGHLERFITPRALESVDLD